MKRIFFLCILLAFCGAAQAADTLTKWKVRNIPPAQLTRRTLDQLSHILIPPRYALKARHPKEALDELEFWTTPYHTDTKNLCAMDLVTVKFRHGGGDRANGHTPAHAYSIQAVPQYHFLAQPKKADWESSEEADRRECDHMDLTKMFWSGTFTAEDENVAHRGMWLLGELTRRAAEPDFAAHVKCNGYTDYFKSKCPGVLATLKMEDIRDIQGCWGREFTCYHFYQVGLAVEVYWTEEPSGHETIDHVDAREVLVTVDARPE